MNVIDLYAGAGGLSLGASRAGFNVLGAVELDPKAIETHIRNFPNTNHFQVDLEKVDTSDLYQQINPYNEEIHGVIGGPPCQGFSSIGKRMVDDSRNSLFIRFFKIVSDLKPAFFVAENVLGILNEQYTEIRKQAFSYVSDYDILEPLVVPANEYGAPTRRTRVFFIGFLKDYRCNITEEDFYLTKRKPNELIYVKDALLGLTNDLNTDKNSNGEAYVNKKAFKRVNPSKKYFYSRIDGKIPKGVGDPLSIKNLTLKSIVTGCKATKHSTEIIKRYMELEIGKSDRISRSQKLNPDGFCPTLRAGTGPDKGSFQAVRPIHYKYPRVITVREAARLQGFPDWFVFHPTIWHSFRQIGNSVSPIIAENILSVINQKLT